MAEQCDSSLFVDALLSSQSAAEMLEILYDSSNEAVLEATEGDLLWKCVSKDGSGPAVATSAWNSPQLVMGRWCAVQRLAEVCNAKEFCLMYSLLLSERSFSRRELFLLLGALRITVSRLRPHIWHKQIADLAAIVVERVFAKPPPLHSPATSSAPPSPSAPPPSAPPDPVARACLICPAGVETDIANLRSAILLASQDALKAVGASRDGTAQGRERSVTGGTFLERLVTFWRPSADVSTSLAVGRIVSRNTRPHSGGVVHTCESCCVPGLVAEERRTVTADGGGDDESLRCCLYQLICLLFGLALQCRAECSAPTQADQHRMLVETAATPTATRLLLKLLVEVSARHVIMSAERDGLAGSNVGRKSKADGELHTSTTSNNLHRCVLQLIKIVGVDPVWLFEVFQVEVGSSSSSTVSKNAKTRTSSGKHDDDDDDDISDDDDDADTIGRCGVSRYSLACYRCMLVTHSSELSALPEIWRPSYLLTCTVYTIVFLLSGPMSTITGFKLALSTLDEICGRFWEPYEPTQGEFEDCVKLLKTLCQAAAKTTACVQDVVASLKAFLKIFEPATCCRLSNAVLDDEFGCEPFIAGCVFGSVKDALASVIGDERRMDCIRRGKPWQTFVSRVLALELERDHWMQLFDRYIAAVNLVRFLMIVSKSKNDENYFFNWTDVRLGFLELLWRHLKPLEAAQRMELDQVQESLGCRHPDAESKQVVLHHLDLLLSLIGRITDVAETTTT